MAMLEPAPKETDSYNRPREKIQDEVLDNVTPEEKKKGKIYEIERLVDRKETKQRGRGKKTVVKYLVKWKDWGSVQNVWYPVEDLQKAKESMEDYDTEYRKRSMREYRKSRNLPED